MTAQKGLMDGARKENQAKSELLIYIFCETNTNEIMLRAQ